MPSPSTIRCRDKDGNFTEPILLENITDRLSIYGIIIENDHVLALPQWEGYVLPGGGHETGEPLSETLKREVGEETGFEIEPGNLASLVEDYFAPPNQDEYWHGILLYYIAHITGGELTDEFLSQSEVDLENTKQAEWLPLEDISQYHFYGPCDVSQVIAKAQSIKLTFCLCKPSAVVTSMET